MTIQVKSTKAWHKLPCAHTQFFDTEEDGSAGECASIHGYDRTVKLTFAGDIDEMGWIVPFGELKPVKTFIEYYFDHTTVIPANDPRVDEIVEWNMKMQSLSYVAPFQLRILPYGVSMEMSSLFIWEQVNPYIVRNTNNRCYVEKVESIEHDSNSAYIEVDRETAIDQGSQPDLKYLTMKNRWPYKLPQLQISDI